MCVALPLVNKPGTSISCDTQADALARFAAAGAQNGLDGKNHLFPVSPGNTTTANTGGHSTSDDDCGDNDPTPDNNDGSDDCDDDDGNTDQGGSGNDDDCDDDAPPQSGANSADSTD